MSNKQTCLDELRRALREEFGLEEKGLAAAAETKSPVFFVDQNLQLERHCHPNHDLLVYDPLLGSLGIVRFVERKSHSRKAKQEFHDAIKKCVKEATYVRHLLETDPRRQPLGRQAKTCVLSVELVLVTTAETAQQQIGEILRELARETPYLTSVGVHVLRYEGGKTPYRKDIRRAFCWLLQATRLWYQSQVSKRSGGGKHSLTRLKMSNFRLAGRRTLNLDQGTKIHLVSGRNGSGKSALVESVELALTGQISRLGSPSEKVDYAQILTNRDHRGRAGIELTFQHSRQERFRVTPDGTREKPLKEGLCADSFRLNQSLMNQLTVAGAGERAATFIRAFFPEPEQQQALERYREAREADKHAMQSLSELHESLETANRILDCLRSWTGTTASRSDVPFEVALNDWLESCALADLARKHVVIGETMSQAQQAGWSPPRLAEELPSSLRTLISRDLPGSRRLLKVVEERFRQLDRDVLPGAGAAKRAGSAGPASVLPPHDSEVETLNEVGKLLFPASVFEQRPRLGQAIRNAINSRANVHLDKFIIGGTGWAEKLQSMIAPLVKNIQKVLRGETPPPWTAAGEVPEVYENARQVREKLQAAEQVVNDSFIKRIGRQASHSDYGQFLLAGDVADSDDREPEGLLNAALNEIMALFTPARWAYEDLAIWIDDDGGMHYVIRDGKQVARADLRFNTAELNLLVVSLFLLCAVRVDNPLNLLVLDDPLQNMDELTVTALARGLAKIVRVWHDTKRDWQLMMLFHGVRDLERFCVEVPSAVYLLPWLSPNASTRDKREIPKDKQKSNLDFAVQDLLPLTQVVD